MTNVDPMLYWFSEASIGWTFGFTNYQITKLVQHTTKKS